MRLLIIACAALPLSAATAEPPPAPAAAPSTVSFGKLDPAKQCPTRALQPASPRETPKMRRLGELPPAEAFHAVYRTDGEGCIDPVMVGYQYGRK